jgi:hypothetical protein
MSSSADGLQDFPAPKGLAPEHSTATTEPRDPSACG